MEESSLLHQCLLENNNFNHKDCWVKNIKQILNLKRHDNILNEPHTNSKNIKRILQFKFIDWWHDKLFNDSNTKSPFGNKLRHYRIYKNSFRKEEYLNILTYRPFQNSYAQLRLRCHKLHIETGRYARPADRLPPTGRLCKHCCLGVCENEHHFILTCDLYSSERKRLLEDIKVLFPHISIYSHDDLFKWPM